jgi:hypothetical protein
MNSSILVTHFATEPCNQPVRGIDHRPHYSTEVKERVAIPVLYLWVFMTCYRVNFTFYPATKLRFPYVFDLSFWYVYFCPSSV